MRINENGKTSILFLLISCAGTAYYVLIGRDKIKSLLPENLDLVLLALLAVITLFSLIFNIVNLFSGGASPKKVKKQMRNKLIELSQFVDFANERVAHYEESSKFYMHAIKPIGIDSFSEAKKIVQCLVIRINQVNELLGSTNKFDLFEAEELLKLELDMADNCIETLIGTNPCEPVPIEQCIQRVSSLLDRVDMELETVKRAA